MYMYNLPRVRKRVYKYQSNNCICRKYGIQAYIYKKGVIPGTLIFRTV